MALLGLLAFEIGGEIQEVLSLKRRSVFSAARLATRAEVLDPLLQEVEIHTEIRSILIYIGYKEIGKNEKIRFEFIKKYLIVICDDISKKVSDK